MAVDIPTERPQLNERIHKYEIRRVEGSPVIPCDMCMSGYTTPWHIGFFLNETLAYVVCAADAVDISLLVDSCTDCIDDPTAERVCDTCGKDYRRRKPVVQEVAA